MPPSPLAEEALFFSPLPYEGEGQGEGDRLAVRDPICHGGVVEERAGCLRRSRLDPRAAGGRDDCRSGRSSWLKR